jgi:hypothetical protein
MCTGSSMPAWPDDLSREQAGRRKIRRPVMRANHRSQDSMSVITVTNWCGEKRAAALGGLVNHRTGQTMTRPALQLMTKRVLASILLWSERICWRSWHDQTCQIHQNAIPPACGVDCMWIVLLKS